MSVEKRYLIGDVEAMISRYTYEKAFQLNEKLKNKRVVIWGLSISALETYQLMIREGIFVTGFTDSFTKGEETFAGLPVYSFEKLKEMRDIVIFISTRSHIFQREIFNKISVLEHVEVYIYGDVYGAGKYNIKYMRNLIEKNSVKINFVKENLLDDFSKTTFDKLLEYRVSNNSVLLKEIFENSHKQYFPSDDIFEKRKEEIFIDAGAYNGATSLDFIDWVDGAYSKIYLLEPDSLMYEITKERLKIMKVDNAVLLNKGAYSTSCEVSFKELNETGSSCISEMGEKTIKTISIDEMVEEDNVTFIKMDIEGAEMEALIGAMRTIERCKPKLAISVYHKEDDIWEIPYYIKKNYPWYKMYLRHYTDITTETVLYATV